jgi:high-affinity iron transporter
MSSIPVQAATIIFREGLEVLLMMTALTSYLASVGAHRRLFALYAGCGFGAIVCLAIAWTIENFYQGPPEGLGEGIVVVAAAGLMLYVSGWLFISHRSVARQNYLKARIDKALSYKTGLAVAVFAFVTMFREACEAILFLFALTRSAGGWSMGLIAGLVVGALLLAALFLALNAVSRRFTLRVLFLLTSLMLFVIALRFIGDGLQEFQLEHIFTRTPIVGGDWLDAIGLNATWEAVIAQLAAVSVVAVGFLTLARRDPEDVTSV